MGSLEVNIPRELGQHLTGMDNLFFQLERSNCLMTVCSVWTFNQRLDTTLVLAAIENLCNHYPRFCLVPKYCSRLETPVWSRPHKHWKFKDNILFHTLTSPTIRCLQEYTASQYVVPFDRSKPLWEVHYISGLKNQQFAFLWKAHHSMSDGVGIMKAVLSTTTSLDPAKETLHIVEHLQRRQSNHSRGYYAQHDQKRTTANRKTSSQTRTRSERHQAIRQRYLQQRYEAARNRYGAMWQAGMIWLAWIWQTALLIKYQMYHELWTIYLFIEPIWQHVLRPLFLWPLWPLPSVRRGRLREMSYPGRQTHDKLIAWTDDMDIADIHKIQKAFGSTECTLNDVMLLVFGRCVQRYLHRYHQCNNNRAEAEGKLDLRLRIMIPLSFRSPADWEMKNIVTGSLLTIDTDHCQSTTALLTRIHRNMMAVKRSVLSSATYRIWVQWVLRYFPVLMTPPWIQEWYTDLPHAIFTNIVGPTEHTFFGGQEMTRFHVLPPQAGKGCISVGLVSYCDRVNVTMLTDNHPTCPDLANILCSLFVNEFNDLVLEAKMKPDSETI